MKPYLIVPVVYLAVGAVWIIASDLFVEAIAPSSTALTSLQTSKGWLFVIASTLLIYILTKKAFERMKKAENMKRAVFKKTLEASHHILLNYLNQMQLVTLEAECSDDFDPEVLALARRVSETTAQDLVNLESMEIQSPDDIEAFIYRGLRETRRALERTAPMDGAPK